MKVLVVGASGLVGGSCFSLFKSDVRYHVDGTYLTYAIKGLQHFDPTYSDELNRARNEKYDVIIHTAGLSNVDQCERDPSLSFQMNVGATKIISELASVSGAKLVFISTDYIFDGMSGPYPEEATPNPLNIYGKHKLEAEKLIQRVLTNYLILRVTNVYGNELRSKNFVARILMDIKNGLTKELHVASDQYATPVNSYDIARSIKVLIEDNARGIFNIAGNEFLSRLELAKCVINAVSSEITVIGKTTGELKQIADRPLKGGLVNSKFLKQFPNFNFESVLDYIKEKKDV